MDSIVPNNQVNTKKVNNNQYNFKVRNGSLINKLRQFRLPPTTFLSGPTTKNNQFNNLKKMLKK